MPELPEYFAPKPVPHGTFAEPLGTLIDAANRVSSWLEWLQEQNALGAASLQADDLRRLVDHARALQSEPPEDYPDAESLSYLRRNEREALLLDGVVDLLMQCTASAAEPITQETLKGKTYGEWANEIIDLVLHRTEPEEWEYGVEYEVSSTESVFTAAHDEAMARKWVEESPTDTGLRRRRPAGPWEVAE